MTEIWKMEKHSPTSKIMTTPFSFQRNRFQVVWVTDGCAAFAIFGYSQVSWGADEGARVSSKISMIYLLALDMF